MCAVQFEDIGTPGFVNLQNAVKGDFVGTTAINTAPIIQHWNQSKGTTGGYDSYYYFSSTLGGTKLYNVWSTSRSTSSYDDSIKFAVGDSFWFKDQQADCNVTAAGAIVGVDETGKTGVDVVVAKWNMIANPFPKAFNLNTGIDWTLYLNGTTAISTAPVIQVWNTAKGENGGYDIYYFFSSTLGGTKQYNVWSTSRSTSSYDPNVSVAAGSGFWLKYSSDNSKSEKPDKSLTLKFAL